MLPAVPLAHHAGEHVLYLLVPALPTALVLVRAWWGQLRDSGRGERERAA